MFKIETIAILGIIVIMKCMLQSAGITPAEIVPLIFENPFAINIEFGPVPLCCKSYKKLKLCSELGN